MHRDVMVSFEYIFSYNREGKTFKFYAQSISLLCAKLANEVTTRDHHLVLSTAALGDSCLS